MFNTNKCWVYEKQNMVDEINILVGLGITLITIHSYPTCYTSYAEVLTPT